MSTPPSQICLHQRRFDCASPFFDQSTLPAIESLDKDFWEEAAERG